MLDLFRFYSINKSNLKTAAFRSKAEIASALLFEIKLKFFQVTTV